MRINKPSTTEEMEAVVCHKRCDQMNIHCRIRASGACSRIAIIKNKDNRFLKFGHIFTKIHGQRIASATIATMITATDHFCVVTDRSSSCSFICHSDLCRASSDGLLDNCSKVLSLTHHSSHLPAKHLVDSWYTPVETDLFKFCDAVVKALCKLSVRSLTTGLVSHIFPVSLCSIVKPSRKLPCSYATTKIFCGGIQLKAWTSVVLRKNTLTKTVIGSMMLKTFLALVTFMIKKFSSPKIKIWFESMFFFGFFCGFERCGSAAFPNFRGGISSPPQAAKCVRTNSRILHHVGNCKFEGFASLRSATNSYSILGVKTNSRFRILGEENFLILNF